MSPVFAAGCVLLQGAMDKEVNYLVSQLKDSRRITVDGYDFWSGVIYDQPVVVAKTGIGEVNAAVSTLLAVKRFAPRVIINQGTAGGYPEFIHTGDIVIGEKILDCTAIIAARRDSGAGLDVNQWKLNEVDFTPILWSDKTLVKTAEKCAAGFDARVYKGTVASSNRWSRELDLINMWCRTQNALAEEMETTACATVAGHYQVAFLSIRIIADSEINNESYDPDAAKAIAENCQKFSLKVLKAGV